MFLKPQTTLILLIVFLASFLRGFGGFSTILFTYDQGRDLLVSSEILKGDLKIVGPPTDIPSLHHGPIYYYLLAFLNIFSHNDPEVTAIFFVFINLASLPLIFFLSEVLFENRKISLISIFLFAVSYEAVSYGRWISNPSPAIPTLALYFLGMAKILKGQKYGLVLATIGASLSFQLQFFLVYLIPTPFVLNYFLSKNKHDLKQQFFSVLIAIASFFPFVAASIKFRSSGLNDLFKFVSKSTQPQSFMAENFTNFLNKSSSLLENNFSPNYPNFSAILGLFAFFTILFIVFTGKKRGNESIFLLAATFSSFPLFIVSKFNSPFVTMSSLIPLLILMAFFVFIVFSKSKLFAFSILALIGIFNINAIFKNNPKGNEIFKVQNGMILQDEQAVVARTYQIAKDSRFSISSINNPLYQPTTWAYLYSVYSQKNHKILPFYHGNTASQFVGDKIFERSGEITKYEFTIIEPEIDPFWQETALKEDEKRLKVQMVEQIGNFKLLIRN